MFDEIFVDDSQPITTVKSSCLGMQMSVDEKTNVSSIDFKHWVQQIEERKNQIFSKRNVASTVASCYSVDNLLAPITYYGKATLNLIWQIDKDLQTFIKEQQPQLTKSQIKKHSIGWDVNLDKVDLKTDEMKKKLHEAKLLWNTFEAEISKLKHFKVPRYILGSSHHSKITER